MKQAHTGRIVGITDKGSVLTENGYALVGPTDSYWDNTEIPVDVHASCFNNVLHWALQDPDSQVYRQKHPRDFHRIWYWGLRHAEEWDRKHPHRYSMADIYRREFPLSMVMAAYPDTATVEERNSYSERHR